MQILRIIGSHLYNSKRGVLWDSHEFVSVPFHCVHCLPPISCAWDGARVSHILGTHSATEPCTPPALLVCVCMCKHTCSEMCRMLQKKHFLGVLLIRGDRVRDFQFSLGVYFLLDLIPPWSIRSPDNKVCMKTHTFLDSFLNSDHLCWEKKRGVMVEVGGQFEVQGAKSKN